jgi:hypothetical protein
VNHAQTLEDLPMRFANWVFLIAGIYGLLIVTPMFFSEARMGDDYPPPINHPEWYYGFAGAALSWQLVYLLISSDPVRYRPLMLLGAIAKLAFFGVMIFLYLQERVAGGLVGLASPDGILAVFFLAAWLRTPAQSIDAGYY